MNPSIKKIDIDNLRADSLKKMSENSLNILKLLKPTKETYNIIFREIYEGLRQSIESIGYSKGYKFRSHEALTIFLKETLKEEEISSLFDKYRKLRNRLNYYGKAPNEETVKEAIKEIPKIIKNLEKHRK